MKISRGEGVKISTIFSPSGRVGIPFGSVKIKAFLSFQEIIDMIFYNDRFYQVNIEYKQNFVFGY